jgi:hypothetical protein
MQSRRSLLAGAFACAAFIVVPGTADARRRRRRRLRQRAAAGEPSVLARLFGAPRRADPRPRAWCGWWMRHHVSQDPGVAFNLARNWARYGRAAGGPAVGVIVVWPHHVGIITGRDGAGQWIVKSGNDGHAVRERARSLDGVFAYRWP